MKKQTAVEWLEGERRSSMKKYYLYRFISTTLAVALGIIIASLLLVRVL